MSFTMFLSIFCTVLGMAVQILALFFLPDSYTDSLRVFIYGSLIYKAPRILMGISTLLYFANNKGNNL